MKRLTLFLLLLLGACSDRPYQQGAHLLYYPQRNAYLDQDNRVYLLFDTVEQRWTRRAQLSQPEEAALGESVVIDHPAVPVYRDNAQHRMLYATLRYTDPAALARKRREDSLAASPPPVPDTSAAPEPKKKSRVGRWLQKLFGKK